MDRQTLLAALSESAHRTTKTNIQSTVRDLPLHRSLNLADGQVVNLEAPSGTSRSTSKSV